MKRLLYAVIICMIIYFLLFLFYLLYLFITNFYILDERNILIQYIIIFICTGYFVYGSGIPQHHHVIDALDSNKLWFLNRSYILTHARPDLEEQKLKSKFYYYIRITLVQDILLTFHDIYMYTGIYLRKVYERFKRKAAGIIKYMILYKILRLYNISVNRISLCYTEIHKWYYMYFRRIIRTYKVYRLCKKVFNKILFIFNKMLLTFNKMYKWLLRTL